jgi:hypothetical protein
MKSLPPHLDLSAAQEAAFEKKAEKHFKSHRELPAGRNFTCWNRDKDTAADRKYRENFDSIFPNAPGAGI